MKPILFSAPTIRAILRGQKTQTRRIIKPQPPSDAEGGFYPGNLKCAYGTVGDRLWVRETWREAISDTHKCFAYRADNTYKCGKKPPDGYVPKWKPSIFMPKEACRIFLQIEQIKIERLQDISEEDAIAEGIENTHIYKGYRYYRDYECGGGDLKPLESFRSLWESINGKGSWDVNPWVWVIKFSQQNKDAN